MKQGSARGEFGASDMGILAVLTSVVGGPVAWSLHLFISYFLVTIGCTTGWGGTVPAILIVTILLAAAAFGSGVVAFRRWRQLDGAPQDWREALSEPRGRGGLLWMVGILSAALFGVVILLAGLPPLFVPICT